MSPSVCWWTSRQRREGAVSCGRLDTPQHSATSCCSAQGGVTAKLALRTISWQQLVLWVPIVYVVCALALAMFAGARLSLGGGGAWAAATALCAAACIR
jgi:hypothetical protein